MCLFSWVFPSFCFKVGGSHILRNSSKPTHHNTCHHAEVETKLFNNTVYFNCVYCFLKLWCILVLSCLRELVIPYIRHLPCKPVQLWAWMSSLFSSKHFNLFKYKKVYNFIKWKLCGGKVVNFFRITQNIVIFSITHPHMLLLNRILFRSNIYSFFLGRNMSLYSADGVELNVYLSVLCTDTLWNLKHNKFS